MPETSAATTAFATSTSVRFGTAANVVRMRPLRYSLVTLSADEVIITGTPNTTTPIAAFSDGTAPGPYAVDTKRAANPKHSTAIAAADHSSDLVVNSLM